jgi:hypothetical protein
MALRRCLQPWLQQNFYLVEQRVPQAAWAYSSSSKSEQQQEDNNKPQQPVSETQQQQASSAAATPQSTTSDTLATASSRPKAAEEWTEVVDEKSGQTYYWNEKTGRASGCLVAAAARLWLFLRMQSTSMRLPIPVNHWPAWQYSAGTCNGCQKARA